MGYMKGNGMIYENAMVNTETDDFNAICRQCDILNRSEQNFTDRRNFRVIKIERFIVENTSFCYST